MLPFSKQAGENSDEIKTKAFAHIAERTVPGRWEHAQKPTLTEFKHWEMGIISHLEIHLCKKPYKYIKYLIKFTIFDMILQRF